MGPATGPRGADKAPHLAVFPVLKWWILAVPVTLAIIVSVSWYEQDRHKAIIRQRACENLETMLHYKTELIKLWYTQSLRNAENLAEAWMLDAETRNANHTCTPSEEIRWLQSIQSRGFSSLVVLDQQGNKLAWQVATAPEHLCFSPKDQFDGPIPAKAMSNLHQNPSGWFHLDIIVPLKKREPSVCGPAFLVLGLDGWKSLLRTIAKEPNNTETGETLLVQREGKDLVYMNATRFGNHPPLSLKEADTASSPAWKALNGDILWGEGTDYRGERVVFATHYVPWLNWGILGKMDEKEVFATARASSLLAWTVSVLAFCLFVATIYAGWSRHHARETRLLLEALLDRKQALEVTMRRLFNAQEEERQKLSLELHDDIVQNLGSAEVLLTSLRGKVSLKPDSLEFQALTQATEAISQAATECREILERYRPAGFHAGSLPDKIRAAASRVPNTEVDVVIDDSPIWSRLSYEAAVACYRIVQEALANIRKHAQATQAWIRLHCREESILLEIQDNGLGFEPEEASRPLHCGLETMKERARLVGGTLEIDSGTNGGTIIRVQMPAWVQTELEGDPQESAG